MSTAIVAVIVIFAMGFCFGNMFQIWIRRNDD